MQTLWVDALSPMQLIFSDGSNSAYGACVYVRWVLNGGGFESRLAISKNRLVYTMPGLGMNFLFFFSLVRLNNVLYLLSKKKKKTGHNVRLVKSWIPSSFV